MKLIPGKYWDNCDPDFKIPVWDFIEMTLRALGLNESYLSELFDISKTAINHWKSEQNNIGMDKIPVLCELFGITVDQFFERESNDDFQYDDFYGLSEIKGVSSFTQFDYRTLDNLFQKLSEASIKIECFSLGYIPLTDENGEETEYCVDFGDIEYYCQVLDINVTYDTIDGKKHTVASIKYSELCSICDTLKSDWGQLSYEHIHAEPSKEYLRILLLSENYLFLRHFASDNEYQENIVKYELLELWTALKKESPEYDPKNNMAKTLLACGASYLSGDRIDEVRTLQLCRDLISQDNKELFKGKELKDYGYERV